MAADAGCLRGVGITAGTTATTFSPESPVTRAQTATLLARVWELSGRDCPDGAPLPFDDVAPDSVHHDGIMCLRALGITSGTSATTFSPGSHVSRAQFATMVARLYNLISPPPAPEPEPEQPASEPEAAEVEPEVEEPEPETAESDSAMSETEAEEPTVEPESELEAEVESESAVGVLLPAPSRPMPPGGGSGPPANGAAGSVHTQGILTVFRLGIMPLVSVVADPDPGAPAVMGFAPGRSMTRGDVAAPLVRLWQVLGEDCPTDGGAPFEDIDDLQLAADAGCLRGVGITAGTTATTFSPGSLVTRAQVASLLVRVWRLSGRDCPDGAPLPFDDVAAGSVHHDGVMCLRALGITSGTSASTFSPGSQVSRAQFATMVARLHTQADPAGAG